MNLPCCALGPSVGPSHVATCDVDAPTSALAAASASAPAWAVITGCDRRGHRGGGGAEHLHQTPDAEHCPGREACLFEKTPACRPRHAGPPIVQSDRSDPLKMLRGLLRGVLAQDRSSSIACVPPLPRTWCSLLRREHALPAACGISGQAYRHDE